MGKKLKIQRIKNRHNLFKGRVNLIPNQEEWKQNNEKGRNKVDNIWWEEYGGKDSHRCPWSEYKLVPPLGRVI